MRLISADGRDLGLMTGVSAFRHAQSLEKDVLQVSHSDPPVVRLLNYAEYDLARKQRKYEKRKQRKQTDLLTRKENILKQVRLSPVTSEHDMQTKMRRVKHFLLQGHRVKVYIQFRRGHGKLKENAKQVLIHAVQQLDGCGSVQNLPPGGLEEMFVESPEDEQSGDVSLAKKPLQVIMLPLSRKERELLDKEGEDKENLIG